MKPGRFSYAAPESTNEVFSLLKQYGDDAKLLAGGQTLGPMLNLRVIAPRVVIDINRVDGLGGLSLSDPIDSIGALTRQSTLEDHPQFCDRHPLIAEALPHIAHRPIRNRGTVGGSLAHADPAAEWGALVLATDASLVIADAAETYRIAAKDFFLGPLTTQIQADQLLLAIELPRREEATGEHFVEFSRRRGDFAMVGVACRLILMPNRQPKLARIALIGVEDVPLRAERAEAIALEMGNANLDESLAAIGQAAAEDINPIDDLHASSHYKRKLTNVLVQRAVREAWIRAQRATTPD
ncbi:MAG: xanthine dehydrogenase family protein subunit M [Pseudomonadota bacterium]